MGNKIIKTDDKPWKQICIAYWNARTLSCDYQLCNGRSFAIAMRLKYGLLLDNHHHWTTYDDNHTLRYIDFIEYLNECLKLNKEVE